MSGPVCRKNGGFNATSNRITESNKQINLFLYETYRRKEYREVEKCNFFLDRRRIMMIEALIRINKFKYYYLNSHEYIEPGDEIQVVPTRGWTLAKGRAIGVCAKHYYKVRRKWQKKQKT